MILIECNAWNGLTDFQSFNIFNFHFWILKEWLKLSQIGFHARIKFVIIF